MENSLKLPKYSIGVGDRFSLQGKAQLQACAAAMRQGVEVIPVWNKSNREHTIIGSEPWQTRHSADAAVAALAWPHPYFVDADHINLETVDRFIEPCDFFTIDVSEKIGMTGSLDLERGFVDRHPELLSEIRLAGSSFQETGDAVTSIAHKYLAAVAEAGKVYRYIAQRKGFGRFIPEISMDETDCPQKPMELLVILAAISDEQIPIQTIAPKFSGRFNKGVDYSGDLDAFTREFSADLAVLAHATREYPLPVNLKLSIHSGSDKFSLYPIIHAAIQNSGAGLHLKTAGTTWLEELAGMARSGGCALELAKEIYASAYQQIDDLCKPYASVIAVDVKNLPLPSAVRRWNSAEYAGALHHDEECPLYNQDMRQLLHVSFKIAAKLGRPFLEAIETNKEIIAEGVTANLFERHISPVFIAS